MKLANLKIKSITSRLARIERVDLVEAPVVLRVKSDQFESFF